MTARY